MRIPIVKRSFAVGALEFPGALSNAIDFHRPALEDYEDIRKQLHAHPELSRLESKTADLIKDHLQALGSYEIHSNIGGHGLAAVFKNGAGPTILLRADMDALPVKEKTGLPYASKVVMEDYDGNVQPVMHACGHDVHVTCLLAAADTLIAMSSCWSGTLILVFQPDEEKSGGAQRMVDDGLYDVIPVPDIVLGQHVFPGRAGRLGVRKGIMLAASDSLQITFHGKGGHASMPQNVIDPVIMAASCIMRLQVARPLTIVAIHGEDQMMLCADHAQTIVSRETAPGETAVVTVAKLQASNAENIISNEASISINIRTTDPAIRSRVLSSVERIVKAESDASGAPTPPTIKVLSTFPVTVNDDAVTEEISRSFKNVFGTEFDPDVQLVSGSEDFPVLATSVGKPLSEELLRCRGPDPDRFLCEIPANKSQSCYWFIAGTDPDQWDEAERKGMLSGIPTNHSALFAPVMDPTLRIGTDALVAGALTFLGQK